MVELLRYANRAKVAEALGVSRATTSMWARGRQVSPYRLREVEALLNPGPDRLDAIQAGVERVENQLVTLRAILEARTAPSALSGGDPVGDPAPPRTNGKRGR